jgi:ornithine cyclodeaminase/alanine dehydrogenase-like protein (mu-crystallin family)
MDRLIALHHHAIGQNRGQPHLRVCDPEQGENQEKTCQETDDNNGMLEVPMLYFSEEEVRELLPMDAAIEVVEDAFKQLAAKTAINHPRRRLILPTGSVLHYMAAGGTEYFGAKIYSTHPKHGAHFLFLLYRSDDARPLAIFEADHLGQIRTGAASGVATRHMAREDARTLGIIGSGHQAQSQVAAMQAVRKIDSIKVWSRTAEKRDKFAAACGAQAVATAEEAVRGADIVVTATFSREPVLEADWVAPGAHVNAMGSNQATRRELPAPLIARASRIAIDSIEQGRMESGDLLLAVETDWESVIELQDIVAGAKPGRTSPEEITLFKSNGLALEDVAAAAYIYEQSQGQARRLPLLE